MFAVYTQSALNTTQTLGIVTATVVLTKPRCYSSAVVSVSTIQLEHEINRMKVTPLDVSSRASSSMP